MWRRQHVLPTLSPYKVFEISWLDVITLAAGAGRPVQMALPSLRRHVLALSVP
jgi:hypothetical protein